MLFSPSELSLAERSDFPYCCSYQVSKAPVSTTAFQSNGGLLAVGDADGTVSLLRLCDELAHPVPNEKNVSILASLMEDTK